MSAIRKKIIKIYLFTLIIGFSYYLWLEITGIYIPCTVYATTGFKCCGCGVTNMFMSLIHFNFQQAWSYNPVMLSLFFFWNLVAILAFWGRPSLIRKPKILYVFLAATVAILCIYWVLRNL